MSNQLAPDKPKTRQEVDLDSKTLMCLHVMDWAVKELGLVLHDARRRNIRESLEKVAAKVRGQQ